WLKLPEREFAEELRGGLRITIAGSGSGEDELIACARDRYIEKPPLFGQLLGASATDGIEAGNHILLQTDNEDTAELQPLCRIYRHKINGIARLDAVLLLVEADEIEKFLNRSFQA